MTFNNIKFISACAALPLLIAAGCGDEGDNGKVPTETASAVDTYAKIAGATYADSAAAARDLKAAIDAFLAAPSEATLTTAREAWVSAREPYLLTEAFRFYDGPIEELEGQINAWPLDELYIDYVESMPDAGIVNDPSKTIDTASLAALNEQGGEANVATGWHAIEFLLWGQDLSAAGPGARPATDYTAGVGNNDRRRSYLEVVTDLLVSDLESVAAEWTEGGAYRAMFTGTRSDRDALENILQGLSLLSGFETGGERLVPALEMQSQEEEHSCFSDNTHRDMVQDVNGILNVYRGSYTTAAGETISGTSIRDVVAAVDPALAASIDSRIDQSLRAAEALQPPFDQEILSSNPDGRARVEELSLSLKTLSADVQEAMVQMGLTVIEEP